VLDWLNAPNPAHAAKTELYKLAVAYLVPPGWQVFGRDVHYELASRLPSPAAAWRRR